MKTACGVPAGILLGVLLTGLAGCAAPTGVLEGAVSVDGEPITFGTVAFVTEDGRTASAMIQPDGRYRAEKVPVGDAVITVHTYPLPPQMEPPDKKPAGPPKKGKASYVPIPPKYGDPKLTPLHTSVAPGTHTYDVLLTRK